MSVNARRFSLPILSAVMILVKLLNYCVSFQCTYRIAANVSIYFLDTVK